MEWVVAWTQAQRDLREASKIYDRLRELSPRARAAMGISEHTRQRRLAHQRFKMADQACLSLRRIRHKAGRFGTGEVRGPSGAAGPGPANPE